MELVERVVSVCCNSVIFVRVLSPPQSYIMLLTYFDIITHVAGRYVGIEPNLKGYYPHSHKYDEKNTGS